MRKTTRVSTGTTGTRHTRSASRPARRMAVVAATALLGVAACAEGTGSVGGDGADAGGDAGSAGGEASSSFDIDMASVYDAQAPQSQAAERFTEMVAECSDGQITINFFPNGALGTETDNFNAVENGELGMVLGGAVGLDMFAPEFLFYQTPFMMKDLDHVRAFIDSDLHTQMVEAMKEHNVRLLAHIERGVRNSTSDTSFTTPEELSGIRFRLPEIPTWVAVWDGVGVRATPVALPELYGALQTGVVGASEGPYEQFATFSLNEVQDYVINTQHVFEVVQFWMNDELYQSMSEDQRECIDQSAEEAAALGTEMAAEANEGFLQTLVDSGMEVVEPDREAFLEAARQPLEDLFDTQFTVTTYDEVVELSS